MIKILLRRLHILLLILALLVSVVYAQDEPSLPSGLGEDELKDGEEPALPSGLTQSGDKGSTVEPALPQGLTEKPEGPPDKEAEMINNITKIAFDMTGYWDARVGVRTQQDPYEKDMSLGETRLQLEIERDWTMATFRLKTDLLYDPVFNHHRIHMEKGQGWLDLRETSLSLTPTSFMDVKVGRQILTWGTGDMLFINDLFPKDWNSFFIGRDSEYLKAPSDAIKTSLYSGLVNIDIIYTPCFDSDRYIDGRRISYWNGMIGRRAGRDAQVRVDMPDDWFDDDEVAWRIFKNLRGYELAIYGYQGFWKSPGGTDPVSGLSIFPGLSVYGASARGVVSKGISNIEIGYYDSEDDSNGTNPFVRNSEFRFLLGYEQEVAKDLTVVIQYYLEHMIDYDNYQRTLPSVSRIADKNRQVVTLRLTKLLMKQDLKLSLFTYYSPTDNDAYLRPIIHYKIDDHWSCDVGGNLFFGKDDHTFFGQFEKNNNMYAGMRYSF